MIAAPVKALMKPHNIPFRVNNLQESEIPNFALMYAGNQDLCEAFHFITGHSTDVLRIT